MLFDQIQSRIWGHAASAGTSAFKDSANLALEFTNKSDQSIFTGRMYYARWSFENEAIWVNFGDDYKNWRERYQANPLLGT